MGLSSDLYTPFDGAPVSLDPSCGRGWSVLFGAELTHVIRISAKWVHIATIHT